MKALPPVTDTSKNYYEKTVEDLMKRRFDDELDIEPEGGGVISSAVIGALQAGAASYSGSLLSTAFLTDVAAGAVLGAALGFAQKALSPSKPSHGSGAGSFDRSPTYGFDNAGTIFDALGRRIPIIYGRERFGGIRIQEFTEQRGSNQYLKMLVLLSEGPIKGAELKKIDGQPADNFDNVEVNYRLGHQPQTPIDGFDNNVKQDSQSGRDVVHNSWQTFTADDDVDKLTLGLIFRGGLFETKDDGTVISHSVNPVVEYRRVGESSWTRVTDFINTGVSPNSHDETTFTVKKTGGLNVSTSDRLKITTGNGSVETRVTSISSTILEPNTYNPKKEYTVTVTDAIPDGSISKIERKRFFSTIRAKSQSAVRKEFSIRMPDKDRWEVRIKRKNAESGDIQITDGFSVSFFRTTEFGDFSYDGYALAGITIQADQQIQGTVPDFEFEVEGKKVQVSKKQTNRFWTRNPAWIVWDVLSTTQKNGGAGIPESKLENNYQDFKNLADYSDESVKDGSGGTHPRHRMDIIIDSDMRVNDFLDQVTSTFSGFHIVKNGGVALGANQANQEMQHVFSPQNILTNESEDSTLQFSYKSRKTKYNSVEVQFRNQNQDYQKTTMVVPREEGLTGDDLQPQYQLNMAGITRPAQAIRVARLALRSENNERLIANFRARKDAVPIEPGDLAGIGHWLPVKTDNSSEQDVWGQLSGQIRGFTDDYLILDQQFDFDASKTYDVTVQLNDGTVKDLRIDNPEKKTNIARVTKTFSSIGTDPRPQSPYVVGEVDFNRESVRMLAVENKEDDEVSVTCVEHDESKFVGIDDFSLSEANISAGLSEPAPAPVESISLSEENYQADDGSINTQLHVYWTPPDRTENVDAYHVYMDDNADDGVDNFVHQGSNEGFDFVITDVPINEPLAIRVVTVFEDGRRLPLDIAPEATITLAGKSQVPPDVQSLEVTQKEDKALIDWNIPDDPIISHAKIKRGPTWDLGDTIANNVMESEFTHENISNGTIKYWIKFISTTGKQSESATSGTVDITGLPEDNIIFSTDENTLPWTGTKDKLRSVTRSGNDILIPQFQVKWDEFLGASETWDQEYSSGEQWGLGFADKFVYTTTQKDIGKKHEVQVGLEYNVDYLPGNATWEEIYDSNDTWMNGFDNESDTWEDIETDPTLTIEYRTSDDGNNWTNWATFQPFKDTFRYIQFRVTLELVSLNDTLELKSFKPILDVKDTILRLEDFTVPSGGTTITFSDHNDIAGETTDFYDPPKFFNWANKGNQKNLIPDYENITADSMDITLYDDAGNTPSGTGNLEIRGF